jgi:4-hydroxy-tetrahydrodipicolinate synthase
MESPFGPLITAMVTPFTPDGAVDYARAEELAQRLVENGSTGLVLSGTTGESPTLTPEEKLELYRRVKQAVNVPIIANTGDNETAFSIEFSREAEKAGVDALLLVVPYYNRPSQEGLYRHFKAIADAVELPCVLYNVPARTARNLEPSTVARLAEVKNIIGVKEASGDLAQVGRIRNLCGERFLMWSGNDGDVLPFIAVGGQGVISVMSHVAGKAMRRMMDAYWKGDWASARDEHLKLLPVADALFPVNSPSPAPVKAALQLQGFDCGGLRLPLVEATEADVETLRQAMTAAGLL